MKEAMFYNKVNGKVKCKLCPHGCIISEGKRGICGVRENRNGKLYSLVYGKLVAKNVDPIEKKPLYHFYPGSKAYSIATVGCNFSCKHCQNYEISQPARETGEIFGRDFSPEEIVAEAKRYNCEVIAYTYTEPTVFYEYAYETAKLASKEGIKNIFVTNGYTSEEALKEISPYLDGANIDLKAFTDKFYREICGARLEPVLETIKLYKELGIWIEITTLVIPTLNDNEEELRKIAEFIKSLGDEIPWHVSAFHPDYKLMNLPRTPLETLRKAYKIGKEVGLKYVYEGNVGEGENTYCYNCGKLLVRRYYHTTLENRITSDSRCYNCNAKIHGVGLKGE